LAFDCRDIVRDWECGFWSADVLKDDKAGTVRYELFYISDALGQRGILRSAGARMVEVNPSLYYLYSQILGQTPTHYWEVAREKVYAHH
jgi:hypothetical protein